MVIDPAPRAFIPGAACLANRKAASRFTAVQARQSSRLMSSTGAVGAGGTCVGAEDVNLAQFCI